MKKKRKRKNQPGATGVLADKDRPAPKEGKDTKKRRLTRDEKDFLIAGAMVSGLFSILKRGSRSRKPEPERPALTEGSPAIDVEFTVIDEQSERPSDGAPVSSDKPR